MIELMTALLKQGELASLQLINIEQQPEASQAYNTRTVPWVKIGDYVLDGLQTQEALQQRIDWTINNQQLMGRFDQQLSTGKADEVIKTLHDEPEAMQAIMQLLGDNATILSTRIGIGVIMEEFANSELLQQQLSQLGQFSEHEDARIRADACHYLSLTGSTDAKKWLQARLNDNDPEVQEVAQDGLDLLNSNTTA